MIGNNDLQSLVSYDYLVVRKSEENMIEKSVCKLERNDEIPNIELAEFLCEKMMQENLLQGELE